jgi:hypothetical protein
MDDRSRLQAMIEQNAASVRTHLVTEAYSAVGIVIGVFERNSFGYFISAFLGAAATV